MRTRSSPIQTPGDQVGGEQVGEHASVDLVGLHARVADRPYLFGVCQHDLAYVRGKDVRNGEGVAGRLEDHAVVPRQAVREESQVLGRGRHTAR
jgi:hypothetical protein